MKRLFVLLAILAWGMATTLAADAPAFESARWIAPPAALSAEGLPLLRKTFTLETLPAKATLRIVGLGDYDSFVNDRRVSSTGINQPWSQYEKTLYYRDFDVTAHLVTGPNCVGVMLLNSFWHNPNPPAGRYNKDGPQRAAAEPFLLCAEVILQSADGKLQRVGTDESWRATTGPVIFSHIFAGEDFDARRKLPGWAHGGFAATNWVPARLVAAPEGTLRPQTWPGFKITKGWKPLAITQPSPGVYLYAFPQNCAAQIRCKITAGKSGDTIVFRSGEHKNRQNRLFGGYVVETKIISDGHAFTHQWSSFYLGMQFVEVTGAVPEGFPNRKRLPILKSMALEEVRTDLPATGQFACSSEQQNRTLALIDSAMRANTSFVMTDCPHREKLGWLECSYLLAPSFLCQYDSASWLEKITRDIRDAQLPNGRVLTVAPSYPAGKFPGAFDWTVEWGAAVALLPWELYQWQGDPQILRDNFDAMKRFTDRVGEESKDGLAPGGLGDWYDYGHGQPPGPSRFTPTELSATATWAMCARAVSRAAEVLGKTAEAAQYRALHAQIATTFQRHFLDPQTGKLRHLGSPQCANAMAICAGLASPEQRAAWIEDIIADLRQRDGQQTPGDIGHVYFIRALAEAGRSDLLHQVYAREEPGSYGGILKKGLTSLPETWDAIMDGSQSLNHCMLGHLVEWYYGYVAGLRQAPGSVGWKKALIAPNPGPLTSAQATLKTPQGLLSCQWRKTSLNKMHLEADVPAGIEAEAQLPSGKKLALKTGKNVIDEE